MAEPEFDARLRSIEARLAITDLVARYAVAVDSRDMGGLTRLFAHDARFGAVNGSFDVRGREAIGAEFRRQLGSLGPSFHVAHHHVIDLDASGSASGIVSAHAEVQRQDGLWITAIRYLDDYVEEGGRWQFASRSLSFLYYVPATEHAAALSRLDRVHAGNVARQADWPERLDSWKAFHAAG